MNFNKVFIFIAFVFAVFVAQTEAGWLKKLGKQIERIGQHTRDTANDVLDVAGKAVAIAGAIEG
uniref:Uncharacterized protein n=1 Tax=Stomoxys calcitrans TaxID=35570 RepID=A0A905STH2_STOCA